LIRGLNGLGGFPIVHLSVLRRYLVPHGILLAVDHVVEGTENDDVEGQLAERAKLLLIEKEGLPDQDADQHAALEPEVGGGSRRTAAIRSRTGPRQRP